MSDEVQQEQAAPAVAEHAAESALKRIEALAEKWGGDVAGEIRHLLAEVRSKL